MSQAREPEAPLMYRNGYALCGALGSDITQAVEIISNQYEVLGSLAYRLLVQQATNAHLSVQEMAAVIARSVPQVETTEPPDRGLAG